jgi:lipoate-protein ligase A
LSSSGRLFDVERFRGETGRVLRTPEIARPTLVLGSTQAPDVISADRVAQAGIEVVRRRGGGGAVLLHPGDHLWVDAWIPRDDPLWLADVSAAAEWAGAWWVAALATAGLDQLEVHAGRAVPGPFGALVCFAGRGPGEVLHRGRKVMGLSQWRSREGALFSTCVYGHWDPTPLVDLLEVEGEAQFDLTHELDSLVAGVQDLTSGRADLGVLRDALVISLPTWSAAT